MAAGSFHVHIHFSEDARLASRLCFTDMLLLSSGLDSLGGGIKMPAAVRRRSLLQPEPAPLFFLFFG